MAINVGLNLLRRLMQNRKQNPFALFSPEQEEILKQGAKAVPEIRRSGRAHDMVREMKQEYSGVLQKRKEFLDLEAKKRKYGTGKLGKIKLAAEQGDARAQFDLGFIYANGDGVPKDDVQAYMWFNLAAARFTEPEREVAAAARDEVADVMTADQVAEAQRLAREWDEAHPRD